MDYPTAVYNERKQRIADRNQLKQLKQRNAELETILRELVEEFNPEPASPPLTLWDRAAAILSKPVQ